LALAPVCGALYVKSIEIPVLFSTGEELSDARAFILVGGSGLTWLLALLSFGAERRIWPAVTAFAILAITQNSLFPMMPIWTLMLLGGWSGWAVLAYIALGLTALVLIVRRVATGRIVLYPISHQG
jgi:hypothetical protein